MQTLTFRMKYCIVLISDDSSKVVNNLYTLIFKTLTLH